jgi:hypothetical protein
MLLSRDFMDEDEFCIAHIMGIAEDLFVARSSAAVR